MPVSNAAKFSAFGFLLLGAFQAALAAGAPWGAAAWGGQHRETLPNSLRTASVASCAFALVMAAIVSGRVPIPFSRRQILSALLIFFVVSIAMNAASRSSVERNIWVPYGFVQLVTVWMARRSEHGR